MRKVQNAYNWFTFSDSFVLKLILDYELTLTIDGCSVLFQPITMDSLHRALRILLFMLSETSKMEQQSNFLLQVNYFIASIKDLFVHIQIRDQLIQLNGVFSVVS